ncbi:DUF4912 domain-containing protein [Desulfovirgula thermocuniculi]|uniref:DUF4912 domain-containing protein n=1 Tax=Desulfovirgula thermocuniculi TaxID=348842 RepID=UPI000411F84F|nr:DUF4912 domain-containing protein [Desulfovirgula thermocuniculi]
MPAHLRPSFFNLLVALPQDPYNLYVYWSFAPERLKVLRSFLQKCGEKPQLVLRLSLNPPSPLTELVVPLEETGCSYIHLQEPLTGYGVEIGFKSPEGKFFSLGHTPVNGPTPAAEHLLPPQPTHQMLTPGYFPLELYRWS